MVFESVGMSDMKSADSSAALLASKLVEMQAVWRVVLMAEKTVETKADEVVALMAEQMASWWAVLTVVRRVGEMADP